MKDAIEITKADLERSKMFNNDPIHREFRNGVRHAIDLLTPNYGVWKLRPSPDTEYKVRLTAWIEGKEEEKINSEPVKSESFKGVPWMNCKTVIEHEEGEG